MEWKTTWDDPLTSYVAAFEDMVQICANPMRR
jgi:hypothetical protein